VAPHRSFNVTREDRTRIHNIIVGQHSIPRTERPDFDLQVGTVVPRSVRLVALPPEILTFEPEWSGLEYFLVSDEIVIVDPATMEIVTVVED